MRNVKQAIIFLPFLLAMAHAEPMARLSVKADVQGQLKATRLCGLNGEDFLKPKKKINLPAGENELCVQSLFNNNRPTHSPFVPAGKRYISLPAIAGARYQLQHDIVGEPGSIIGVRYQIVDKDSKVVARSYNDTYEQEYNSHPRVDFSQLDYGLLEDKIADANKETIHCINQRVHQQRLQRYRLCISEVDRFTHELKKRCQSEADYQYALLYWAAKRCELRY